MQPHLMPRNLFVGNRIPLAGVAHQNGTVRFGRDPKTSALDVNCKAHEVDNLYVVDGSFFPSSGAVNPALTIMANALRVGDRILERLGARAAASMETASVTRRDSTRPSGTALCGPRPLPRRCSSCLAVSIRRGRRRPRGATAPLPVTAVGRRRPHRSPTWIARWPSTPACCRSRRCPTTSSRGARTSC